MSEENSPPTPESNAKSSYGKAAGVRLDRFIDWCAAELKRRNAADPRFRYYAVGIAAVSGLLLLIVVNSFLFPGSEKVEAAATVIPSAIDVSSNSPPLNRPKPELSASELIAAIDTKRSDLSVRAKALWQDAKNYHRRNQDQAAIVMLQQIAQQELVSQPDIYDMVSSLHEAWGGGKLITLAELEKVKADAAAAEDAAKKADAQKKNAIDAAKKDQQEQLEKLRSAYRESLKGIVPEDQLALMNLGGAYQDEYKEAQKSTNPAKRIGLEDSARKKFKDAAENLEGRVISGWVGEIRIFDTGSAYFFPVLGWKGHEVQIELAAKFADGTGVADLENDSVYILSGPISYAQGSTQEGGQTEIILKLGSATACKLASEQTKLYREFQEFSKTIAPN